MMSDVQAAGAKKQVEVQLHWSEYLQGEWSTRESSGFMPVIVTTDPTALERPESVTLVP